MRRSLAFPKGLGSNYSIESVAPCTEQLLSAQDDVLSPFHKTTYRLIFLQAYGSPLSNGTHYRLTWQEEKDVRFIANSFVSPFRP
jgi:hypothetical protein